MAGQSEEFLIKLNQQISGPAMQADGAVARLEAALGRAQEKVAAMSAQKLDTSGMEKHIRMLEGSIRKRKEALANGTATPTPIAPSGAAEAGKAAAQEEVHTKALGKKKAMLEVLSGAQVNYLNAIKSSGGPLASVAAKVEDLSSIMGRAGSTSSGLAIIGGNMLVTVLVKLVAAAAAAAAAIVALSTAITLYALHAADAARSQRLFDDAASGGAARGSELNKVVTDIAGRVPIARAQVAEFGRQLELAGIAGARMQTALEMISAIESVVPGAGAKVEELVERFQRLKRATLTKADLQGTGLALQDVAAQLAKSMNTTQAAALAMLQNGTASTDKVLEAMRAAIEQKFGKTIAAQMMSLSVQFSKLKENIAGLFTGLDLEPILSGLKSITDLFSQNTVTGRVLKETMTLWLQGIFDRLAKVAPYVRAFFLGMAIAALKLYIALKPIAKQIDEAFAGVDKAQMMAMAIKLGEIVVQALYIGLRIMAGALIIAASLMKHFGKSAEDANPKVNELASSIANMSFLSDMLGQTGQGAGGSLGDGLVNGIMAKIPDVMAAAEQMGSTVEQALRNTLGWHSPATVGVDAASAVGDGFDVGADKSADKVDGAVNKMIDPKSAKDAAKSGRGGGKWIYIENFHGSRENLSELRAFFAGEAEFLAGT